MKYAKSMKYGGELINAMECDYDSWFTLGVVCPECDESLYLRAGGHRISSKGKPYKVGAHWCHRQGTPEQVASCEKRVNNYTEKEKAKISAQAKGQRLKLLQRWFWKVVCKYHDSSFVYGDSISISSFSGINCTLNEAKNLPSFKDWFLYFLEIERDSLDCIADRYNVFKNVVNDHMSSKLISYPTELLVNHKGIEIDGGLNYPIKQFPVFPSRQKEGCLISQSQIKQHKNICTEVMEFLYTRQSQEICLSLTLLGAWEVIDYMRHYKWWNLPGFSIEYNDKDKFCLDMPLPYSEFASNCHKTKGFGKSKIPLRKKSELINQWSNMYQFSRLHVFFILASIPWANEFALLESQRKAA